MAQGPRQPGRPRHVPQRTCVACRQGKPKRELVRLVRTAEGTVVVDPTGRRAGRGAYLCHAADCWQAGLRRGVLVRALKIERIPEDDLAALAAFGATLGQPASA